MSLKRSERTATVLPRDFALDDSITTLSGFLNLLHRMDVPRVAIKSSYYRSRVVSDEGSQFTIYSGQDIGLSSIGLSDKTEIIIKKAKYSLRNATAPGDGERKVNTPVFGNHQIELMHGRG